MIPIWKTYVYLPYRMPINKERDVWKIQTSTDIIFRVSSPEYNVLNSVSTPNHLYHYICETCYYSSGNPFEVFRTSVDSAENMKDGPTGDQQTQMSAHARQHSIMFAWARSLEGK